MDGFRLNGLTRQAKVRHLYHVPLNLAAPKSCQAIGPDKWCGVGLGHSSRGQAFYPPTVLTDVKPGMTAFDGEIFGPVIAIVEARLAGFPFRRLKAVLFGQEVLGGKGLELESR